MSNIIDLQKHACGKSPQNFAFVFTHVNHKQFKNELFEQIWDLFLPKFQLNLLLTSHPHSAVCSRRPC